MAKIKNLTLYGSKEEMDRLEEEYRWAGKWVVKRRGPNSLTVFAVPPPKPHKKKFPKKKSEKSEEDRPKRNIRQQRPKQKYYTD